MKLIGEILKEISNLSEEQISEALETQEDKGGKTSDALHTKDARYKEFI